MFDIKRHLSSCRIKLAINCTIGAAVLALLCTGIYTLSFIARQQSKEYHAKQAELQDLDSKLQEAQEDIARLQREKESLNTPQGIEDEARSKLGMIKPGEVIYVSNANDSAEQPDNSGSSAGRAVPENSNSSFVFKALGRVIY